MSHWETLAHFLHEQNVFYTTGVADGSGLGALTV